MRHDRHLAVALFLLLHFSLTILVHAQSGDPEARGGQWESYALPADQFTRYVEKTKGWSLWRPAAWKETGQPNGSISFTAGSREASVTMLTEEVPEGSGIANYTTAFLQQLRQQPINLESVSIRRVWPGGIEGREVVLDLERSPGDVVRETIWMAQAGPRVYLFFFVAAPEQVEKQEPLFKRMMLTLRIFADGKNAVGHWDEKFEKLRARVAEASAAPGLSKSENAVSPEIEAASIATAIRTAKISRAEISQRLTALSGKAPEAALDLMTEADPQVRAEAIRVFSQLGDPLVAEALLWAVGDKDAYSGAVAARAIAEMVNADSPNLPLSALKSALPVMAENPEAILNLAAALSDDKARAVADELLQSDSSKSRLAGLHLAVALPLKGLQLPIAKLLQSKDEPFPALLAEAVRSRRDGHTVPELLKLLKNETEAGAALLLGEVAPVDIAAQMEQRVKEIDARLEKIAPQFKVSSTFKVTGVAGTQRRAAAGKNKGEVSSVPAPPPRADNPEVLRLAEARGALRTAADKITARDRYAKAKDEKERQAVYHETRRDFFLRDWADVVLRSSASTANEPANAAANVVIDAANFKDAPTTGETLFPQDATLYLMAPNFEQTLARLDAALSGVQMETVRDQMTLALLLKTLKAGITNTINAGHTGNASAALGVDLKSPLAVAQWNAGAGSHSAVVLRVTDRARFERMLSLYEKQIGNFDSFAAVASGVARFAGLAPAAVPLVMAAAFSNEESLQSSASLKRHLASTLYFREEKIGNLPVTVIEKLGITTQQIIEHEQIYVAYFGTTAVLAPSRAALIDLLRRATSQPTIAQSALFTQARNETGEVIFFSQLDRLYREAASKSADSEDQIFESIARALGPETGALRLTPTALPTTWETIFRLSLPNNDWMKSFRPFKAQDLAAPRDLLPRATVLYAGAMFDPANLLKALRSFDALPSTKKAEEKKDPEQQKKEKQFDDEFEKLLVPYLHGEAAFALLNLTPLFKFSQEDFHPPAMAFAMRLKNGEAARLFRASKLFSGATVVPEQTALGAPVATLDVISRSIFFTVTDDYIILADSVETLKLLEAKEKFAATRDFQRSTETLPDNLALFTTCSLDAAFDEARQLAGSNENAAQLINVFSAVIHAFHSQRAFIAINPGNDAKAVALEGRLSVSFDREGRYNVGKIGPRDEAFDVANALIAPKGVSILQPTRLETIKLRVTARQPGIIARVRDDLSKFAWQKIEAAPPAASDNALVYTSAARRLPDKLTIKLPVTAAEFQPHLKSTARINTSAPQIVALARQIAGNDRDGRSVARKLGEWTHTNLKWKKVESTTVETLASREADCLEHAELYVALARSLGLPARVVSGAAYGGGSFGAHAWVEIYLGQWVEVDPTWGLMDYVDATHLRFADDAFISYAMLGQVELEILETRSTIADFQRDPVKLVKQFAAEESAASRALAFDLGLTTDRALGAGAFAKLDDKQRAAVINAFERVTAELINDWTENWADQPSILSSEVSASHATLLTVFGNGLLRFQLAARDGAWYITEVENLDEASQLLAEPIRGAASTAAPLANVRRNQFAQPERALKQLDQLIKAEGESAPLLLLKAQTLEAKKLKEDIEPPQNESAKGKDDPTKPDKEEKKPAPPDAATELLNQITTRWPDYAPAWYVLAEHYISNNQQSERAIEPYQRYAKLMPLDPRPGQKLGTLFEQLNRLDEAASAYREAIARDRRNYQRPITLAGFYFNHAQHDKVRAVLAEAFTVSQDADEVFKALGNQVTLFDDHDDPIKERCHNLEMLLTSFTKELAASQEGLRLLARTQEWQENYDAAISSERRALRLTPDPYDHVRIAFLQRKARRFLLSLAAADQAVKLNAEYAGAYYERGCNLARLKRPKEAIKALQKAVEFNPGYQEMLEAEADLKPLASLPEFRALLPKPKEGEKQEEQSAPPAQEKPKP